MDYSKITPQTKQAGVRALERRFGASTMPYNFKHKGAAIWRVSDDETGSFIEMNVSGWRIRVVAERDGEA